MAVASGVDGTVSTLLGRSHGQQLESLAVGVAARGSWANYIGEDNKGTGRRVPIAEANASGRPYAVELALHILGVDHDDRNRLEEFESVVRKLQALLGLQPVVIASGREGHRHLFVKALDGGLRNAARDLVQRHGFHIAVSLRPPLSPHRHGLSVQLVMPGSISEAARLLSPEPRGDLSPRMALLLRDGDTERRYTKADGETDDSRVLTALITSMLNANWTEREAFRALTSPRNRGGRKLHERGTAAAWQYLVALWKRMRRWARTHPPDGRLSLKAAARLDSVAAWALVELPWTMRGHSLWALVAALSLIASEAGDDTAFRASWRQLAERAGLSKETVKRRLRDLVGLGCLTCRSRGIGHLGSVWSLRCPASEPLLTPVPRGASHPLGGLLGLLGAVLAPNHDAMRWRYASNWGLGKQAYRMLVFIVLTRPADPLAVANRIQASLRAVRRTLKRLQKAGLMLPGSLVAIAPDLAERAEAFSRKLGMKGALSRQRVRHAREREAYREAYARRLYAHRRDRTRTSDHGRGHREPDCKTTRVTVADAMEVFPGSRVVAIAQRAAWPPEGGYVPEEAQRRQDKRFGLTPPAGSCPACRSFNYFRAGDGWMCSPFSAQRRRC
jgi:hypothetical protein